MADFKTDLKYILEDAGDADHHNTSSPHRHAELESQSPSRSTPRTSQVVLRGSNSNSNGHHSSHHGSHHSSHHGSHHKSHRTGSSTSSSTESKARPAETSVDNESVFDPSSTMDQRAYRAASPYLPTRGYGSLSYDRYDERTAGYTSSHRDGRLASDGGRHSGESHDNHAGHVGQSNIGGGGGGHNMPYSMEMHGVGSSPLGAGPGVVAEGMLAYETPVARNQAGYGPGPLIPAGYAMTGASGDMVVQQTFFAASPGDGRSGGYPEEVRLTPVTRRVSRAKKGVPVHTCDICHPAKVFTRAEHLRRHQLSHQTPHFQCTYHQCRRSFHRADLLSRHERRHRSGEELTPGGGMEPGLSARRDSSQSIDSSVGYQSAYVSEGGGEDQEMETGGQRHAEEGVAADREQHYHQQYQQQFSYYSSGGSGSGYGDQVNNLAASMMGKHDAGGRRSVQYCVASTNPHTASQGTYGAAKSQYDGQMKYSPRRQRGAYTTTRAPAMPDFTSKSAGASAAQDLLAYVGDPQFCRREITASSAVTFTSDYLHATDLRLRSQGHQHQYGKSASAPEWSTLAGGNTNASFNYPYTLHSLFDDHHCVPLSVTPLPENSSGWESLAPALGDAESTLATTYARASIPPQASLVGEQDSVLPRQANSTAPVNGLVGPVIFWKRHPAAA
ncbi:c2h2 finger domain containing protein [Grosmannia clavigera kw1407]|uniref:C2h2 finger domain containing protein n=1 Tax=Grosmannia clavigera (strain kw1407 / UAMH 11150) TaxID=655863 RepID=F0XDW5_GROCL|nr:c2h2 finger domain containing protein [Grosmannia clavigera kw1407]EFX04645.1 c2h2 finger domain containing protein [Grosmannia clavigera kw1407]